MWASIASPRSLGILRPDRVCDDAVGGKVLLGPSRLAQGFHPRLQDHFGNECHELRQHRRMGGSGNCLMEELIALRAAVATGRGRDGSSLTPGGAA